MDEIHIASKELEKDILAYRAEIENAIEVLVNKINKGYHSCNLDRLGIDHSWLPDLVKVLPRSANVQSADFGHIPLPNKEAVECVAQIIAKYENIEWVTLGDVRGGEDGFEV